MPEPKLRLIIKKMGKVWWLIGDEEPWGPYTSKAEAAWTRDRVDDQRANGLDMHVSGVTDESGKKTREREREVWWI